MLTDCCTFCLLALWVILNFPGPDLLLGKSKIHQIEVWEIEGQVYMN